MVSIGFCTGSPETRLPSYGDTKDILILTNHDESFTKSFLDDGMYFHAPMVKWAGENTGACSWSWMAERADALTEKERQVVEFNRRMEIYAGYTVSFKRVSSRSKGAIGLIAKKEISQSEIDAIWEEHGRIIEQMNNAVHNKLTSLPFPTARRRLTSRQRETLEWVGDGKTTQDIAAIMGLTAATVEKHLRLARETLSVGTTTQAVLKASLQNQIFVIEN